MDRHTIVEWEKRQTPETQIGLGVDAEKRLWIAERKGEVVELSRPEGDEVETVESPRPRSGGVAAGRPKLLGSDLLIGTPDGLRLGDELLLEGRIDDYDGALDGETRVLIVSGLLEGREEGTYFVWWPDPGGTYAIKLLSGPASGVSAFLSDRRVGLAWSDEKGVHLTNAFRSDLETADVRTNMISYFTGDTERFVAPSMMVDPTGKAHALFYVMRFGEDGNLEPSRELQVNFERISFRASQSPDGHFPTMLLHEKRMFMLYGLKPGASTLRWRVPGTTMWDGAEHIPGSFPQAVTDGEQIYIATDAGLFCMKSRAENKSEDFLHDSWAGPPAGEADGPRKGILARLRRIFGF